MKLQLPDALHAPLSSQLDLGKLQSQTLPWLIIGMINARTVNLSHIARQFSGRARVASRYRRLRRFFQYVALDGDGNHAVGTVAFDVGYFGQAGHLECHGAYQAAATLLCSLRPRLDPVVALRP